MIKTDKKFNWLGWLLVLAYIALFFILIFCGKHMESINKIDYRNYFYSAALLGLLASAGIIPLIFYLSLGKLLPLKTDTAKVIFKHFEERKSTTGDGNSFRNIFFVIFFITFELEDGSRIVFKISKVQYETMLENEYGLLTYKSQGKYTYFESFKPNTNF